MEFKTQSPEQTKQVAAELAGQLKGGELIELHGELGAGKTTFVQGLVEALGYVGPVRSPTFSIMNIYQTERDPVREVIHLDFYRLEHDRDLDALGLEEWRGRKDAVMVVEWPKFDNRVEWKSDVRITFESISEQSRTIHIEKYGT